MAYLVRVRVRVRVGVRVMVMVVVMVRVRGRCAGGAAWRTSRRLAPAAASPVGCRPRARSP